MTHAESGIGARRRADGDRLAVRAFFRWSLRYWRGPTALRAWLLTVGLGAAVLCGIAGDVGVAMWNRWFFDALEGRDAETAGLALLAFLALALFITAASVCNVVGRETLQVRWRQWLTRRLVGAWLERRRFYHLGIADSDATIPEYRIADDIRWATEPLIDFYMSLLKAVVAVVSFVAILWVVGGSLTLGSGADAVTIPAYLVIAAVVHGLGVTILMLAFGRTLPGRMAARNEAEAHFRFSLMRLRENAESIAMTRGEAGERASLDKGLGGLVMRWLRVVRQDGQLTWILTGNGVLLPVVPLLLAAPKYLSGEFTLGAVMQLAAAYVPVQGAIAWAVDNFRALSNWHASARRVGELIEAMRELDRDLDDGGRTGIVSGPSAGRRIEVRKLSVANRRGDVLVADAGFDVGPGEKLLITGESGTGKSTLVRAIAGLWPWGSGEVRLPPGATLSFVPQRAYLPLGSLRDAIRYPRDRLADDDGKAAEALRRCGLGHLVSRLDSVERWDQILSSGERQRFAFARLLVQRPDIVILDDALAGLDDVSQAAMMAIVREDLAAATVIGVSHRAGLERFHDRTLAIRRADGGARLLVPLEAAPERRDRWPDAERPQRAARGA